MECNSLINIKFECIDVSKMHNNRAILFFIETGKNGKGIAPDKDWRQLGIYPPLFDLIGYFKF